MQLSWVSCTKKESVTASQAKHLIAPGGVTTLCGCTATTRDVWKANRNKPDCEHCNRALEEMGNSRISVSFAADYTLRTGNDEKWAHLLDGLTVDELLDLIRAAVNKVKSLRAIGNKRRAKDLSSN